MCLGSRRFLGPHAKLCECLGSRRFLGPHAKLCEILGSRRFLGPHATNVMLQVRVLIHSTEALPISPPASSSADYALLGHQVYAPLVPVWIWVVNTWGKAPNIRRYTCCHYGISPRTCIFRCLEIFRHGLCKRNCLGVSVEIQGAW